MPHIKEIITNLINDEWRQKPTISTGLVELDELLEGGLRTGKMYVIASRPSMGKTSFALTIAKNAAIVERKPVAYITTSYDIEKKLLKMPIGKPRTTYIGELPKDKLLPMLDEIPLWIENINPLKFHEEVVELIRDMVNRHGVQIVFVDALLKSPKELTTAIKLCQTAKDLDVACAVLCRVSRDADLRVSNEPHLCDVLPNEVCDMADVVMSLFRPEYYEHLRERGEDEWGSIEGRADIIVVKNRMGETGTARAYYDKDSSWFFNNKEEQGNNSYKTDPF